MTNRIHKHSGKSGFTLVELLIVVAIMSILLGVGSPVLFKASRIYKFKNQTTLIKGMMDEMRGDALNNLAIPSAATATPSSICPSGGYDTNFDGICGDTVPFDYVFEMVFDSNGGLTTLRTYARFSDDQTYGSNDILLSEKDFNTAYEVSIQGKETASTPTPAIYSLVNQTLAFSFAPGSGGAVIVKYNNTNPAEDIFIAGITMTSEDSQRDYNLIIDRTSGIPYEVDAIVF